MSNPKLNKEADFDTVSKLVRAQMEYRNQTQAEVAASADMDPAKVSDALEGKPVTLLDLYNLSDWLQISLHAFYRPAEGGKEAADRFERRVVRLCSDEDLERRLVALKTSEATQRMLAEHRQKIKKITASG